MNYFLKWIWGGKEELDEIVIVKPIDTHTTETIETVVGWLNDLYVDDKMSRESSICDLVDYIAMYRKDDVLASPHIARTIQDIFLQLAVDEEFLLSDAFFTLFSISLEDVIGRRVDIQPILNATSKVATYEEFSTTCQGYLCRISSLKNRSLQEVFLIQLVNFMAENLDHVKSSPRVLKIAQERFSFLETEKNFKCKWFRSLLL